MVAAILLAGFFLVPSFADTHMELTARSVASGGLLPKGCGDYYRQTPDGKYAAAAPSELRQHHIYLRYNTKYRSFVYVVYDPTQPNEDPIVEATVQGWRLGQTGANALAWFSIQNGVWRRVEPREAPTVVAVSHDGRRYVAEQAGADFHAWADANRAPMLPLVPPPAAPPPAAPPPTLPPAAAPPSTAPRPNPNFRPSPGYRVPSGPRCGPRGG